MLAYARPRSPCYARRCSCPRRESGLFIGTPSVTVLALVLWSTYPPPGKRSLFLQNNKQHDPSEVMLADAPAPAVLAPAPLAVRRSFGGTCPAASRARTGPCGHLRPPPFPHQQPRHRLVATAPRQHRTSFANRFGDLFLDAALLLREECSTL